MTSSPALLRWKQSPCWSLACPTVAVPSVAVKVLASLLVWLCSTLAWGIEPADAFLEKLRARGMHDQARAYLKQMQSSPLVSDAFKDRIPLETAQCFADEAIGVREVAKQKRLLEEAAKKLQDLGGQGKPSIAGIALVRLGKIRRAMGEFAWAKGQSQTDAASVAEAQAQLDQASAAFLQAREKLRVWLKELPESPTDPAQQSELRIARSSIVEARYYHADVQALLAATYVGNADKQKELWTAAAAEFGEVHEDYEGDYAAGSVALLRKGECYSALGDRPQALSAFTLALDQAEAVVAATGMTPDIVDGYAKALALFIDEHLKAEQPEFGEVVKRADLFLKAGDTPERPSEPYLLASLSTARAQWGLSKSLGDGSAPGRAAKVRARDLAKWVARFDSAAKPRARELLTEVTGRSQEEAPKAVESFEDGAEQFQQLFGEWAKLASQADPLPEQKHAQAAAREAALLAGRTAHWLFRPNGNRQELGKLLSRMAILHYDAQQWDKAAILAEHVSREFKDLEEAPSAGKIAFSAWRQLATRHPTVRAQAARVAEYVIATWPTTKEAESAQGILVEEAAEALDLALMRQVISRVEEASPRRAQVEIQAGQALWRAINQPALEESQKSVGRTAAIEILETGLKRRGSENWDQTAAGATVVLTLLQIDAGQVPLAIERIEMAEFGVLASVLKDNQPRFTVGLAMEGLKAALRAYMSANPARVDSAGQMLAKMDQLAKSDANSQTAMQQALLSLGKELSQQIKQLLNGGNRTSAAAVAAGATQIFQRVVNHPAATYSERLWVATTLAELATTLDTDGQGKDPQAVELSKLAAQQYGQILAQAATPNYLPASAKLEYIKLRQAACLRGAGDAGAALTLVREVLAQKADLLAAQMEAATCLQALGQTKQESLTQAVLGEPKTEKGPGSIWGWNKICLVLARAEAKNPDLTETYLLARYQLASCRLDSVRFSKENKGKLFAAAHKDILGVLRTHSQKLQQSPLRPKYDAMLKRIQKALGEDPVGLPTAEGKPAAPPPAYPGAAVSNQQ